MRRHVVRLFGALVLSLLSAPVFAQTSNEWSFLPYRDPDLKLRDVLQSVDGGMPEDRFLCRMYSDGPYPDDYRVNPRLVSTVLRHLHFADIWFEKQGFRNLTLRPIGNKALDGTPPGDPVNYVICNYGKPVMLAVNLCYSDDDHPQNPEVETSGIIIGRNADILSTDGVDPVIALSAAHEFAHLVQNNIPARKMDNCKMPARPPIGWIIEGAADAMAIRYVHTQYSDREIFPYRYDSTDPKVRFYKRFFLLRPYYVSLDWMPSKSVRRNRNSPYFLIDYATNGFWYHIIERYLNNTDGNLRRVMDRGRIRRTPMIKYLDEFLNERDGRMEGLRHVFPQFLAEVAQWHKHRFNNKLSKQASDRTVFDGCRKITLSEVTPTVTETVPMVPVAGACLEVQVASRASLQTVTLAVSGPESLADEIYLAGAETSGLAHDFDCYREIERQGARAHPCIISDVQQGRTEPSAKATRYFSIAAAQVPVQLSVTYRLIAAYVPHDLKPAHNIIAVARRKIDFTFTLETAEIEGKPAAAGYAEKRKPGSPVRGSKPPGDLSDALVGSIDTEFDQNQASDPELKMVCEVENKMPTFYLNRQMVTESGEFDETTDLIVATLAPDAGYRPGATGTFKAAGSGSWQGQGYVPALSNPGAISITRNDEHLISFTGSVNTCSALIPPYTADGMCRGTARTFTLQGHVAFPRASECGTRPREELTPAIVQLQDLRLARLGLARQPVAPLPPMLGPGGESAGQMPVAGGGNSGAVNAQCPARAEAGCSCSCALDQCIASGQTQASPLCRLSCQNTFQQCDR